MSEEEKPKGLFGRPPLFKNVDEFTERAGEYFEKNEGGKISWTGLVLAVGASCRQSLESYKKGERGAEFIDPIKKALAVVENYYEETAEGAKSIFILKNFEWRDNIDVNANVKGDITDISDEDLDAKIEAKYKSLSEQK